MALLLSRLARSAATHWKRSLALVLVALVAIGALGQVAGGSFTDDFRTPGTESQEALDLLQSRFPQ
jgi:putative drug exporter of the RND superfamily